MFDENSEDLVEELRTLIQARSVIHGQFTLASGNKSDYYLDIKKTLMHPAGSYLVAYLLARLLTQYKIQAIGGPETSAIAIVASTIAVAHSQHYHDWSGFWIRRETKDHGTKKLVEGHVPEGARVVVVDDVATSGKSLLAAILSLKSERPDVNVVGVIVVVDRLEGAREYLSSNVASFQSLYTINDFDIKPLVPEVTVSDPKTTMDDLAAWYVKRIIGYPEQDRINHLSWLANQSPALYDVVSVKLKELKQVVGKDCQ